MKITKLIILKFNAGGTKNNYTTDYRSKIKLKLPDLKIKYFEGTQIQEIIR